MFRAGRRAFALHHTILLDPVGVGASKFRTDTAINLMDEIGFTAIRGNISEIKTLALGSGSTKEVDADIADARKKLGPDKIIGVSAQTVQQAILAEKHGADYLGVGAVFPTGSKDDAVDVSKETLKAICEAVSIPVIVIGGISRDNVMGLKGLGLSGIAVISAIYAKNDIKEAAKELKSLTFVMVNS